MKTLLTICILILSLYTINAKAQSVSKKKEIATLPDSLPQFPGGLDSSGSFLKRNLRWPEPYIDVQGRVIVKFIVAKNGRIIKPEVIRPLYTTFDAEALRVVRLMPAWVPARLNGKAIDKEYSLPISFTLAED
ncbi:energy transducer TonB [Mucilaginibacter sp. CAU 1740]|uniref:energy transducer TonB n=1 Tax=Mucilaginibacter sp. CAU 1740 TaxID=3140365 RepID=UPI00325BFB09